MNISKLTLSVLAGLSCVSTANAAQTESFEFHGYFRSGYLASAANDFKRSNFAGKKETLGRLGLEADNDYKANLVSNWDFEDDRNFRIHFGIGKKDAEGSLTSSADAVNAGVNDAFVEFDGVSPSGTFWAGRREYGKDGNYIFMTDFFYTDMSGTGIGISGYEIGDSVVDIAYIASDRVDEDYDRWNEDPDTTGVNAANLNNIMHTIHVGSTFGDLKASALLKFMPDNWDGAEQEWAETGFDLTLTYSMYDFFGLGNGFSNIIAQGGRGLGSGNLLGGTITSYNAYAPGSMAQGEHADWANWHWAEGDALALLTEVEDEDLSARVLLWGGYNFDNGMNIFPSIQGQYNVMAEGDNRTKEDYNFWLSAMARITAPVSQHFYMQGEVGYEYQQWGDLSDTNEAATQSKISIAPTFILPTSVGVAPEIRLLATYLPQSWTNKNDAGELEDDFIIGFQADVWW